MAGVLEPIVGEVRVLELVPELVPETHPVSTVQERDSVPALALALALALATEHPEEGAVAGSLCCSKL